MPLCIVYCCSFSRYLVAGLHESLAFGHTLVHHYSSDDQCVSISTLSIALW